MEKNRDGCRESLGAALLELWWGEARQNGGVGMLSGHLCNRRRRAGWPDFLTRTEFSSPVWAYLSSILARPLLPSPGLSASQGKCGLGSPALWTQAGEGLSARTQSPAAEGQGPPCLVPSIIRHIVIAYHMSRPCDRCGWNQKMRVQILCLQLISLWTSLSLSRFICKIRILCANLGGGW